MSNSAALTTAGRAGECEAGSTSGAGVSLFGIVFSLLLSLLRRDSVSRCGHRTV